MGAGHLHGCALFEFEVARAWAWAHVHPVGADPPLDRLHEAPPAGLRIARQSPQIGIVHRSGTNRRTGSRVSPLKRELAIGEFFSASAAMKLVQG